MPQFDYNTNRPTVVSLAGLRELIQTAKSTHDLDAVRAVARRISMEIRSIEFEVDEREKALYGYGTKSAAMRDAASSN